MINYSLQITVQKILISALLLTTISDFIKGFSLDIFVPIINKILPGDISVPIQTFGMNIYVTRFIIRILNLIFALLIVQYVKNKNFGIL
jgi:hypothetical protein